MHENGFRIIGLHWEDSYSFNRWHLASFLSLDVVMSIVILGETFKGVLSYLWPVPHGRSPLRRAYTRLLHNPLRTRLLDRGWCPNEAVLLFKGLDSAGLHLASLLRRPYAGNLRHDKCSDDECLVLQTSEDSYRTLHADDCPGESSCAKISIDHSKLCSILHSGGIPVIYVPTVPEDGSPPGVRMLDFYSKSTEYIAFSHVWAHGLGNPKENSLPSCQILRLKYLSLSAISAQRGFFRRAFWIDTKCIPVTPEYKQYRKLAISRLAATFRDSWRVLVLDADLQRNSIYCSRTELATRIMCSGWMRRLWTLEEAVMLNKEVNATKVDIQLLQGAIEFNYVAGRSVKNSYHAESAIANITMAFPQYLTRDSIFSFLSRGLRYRTTSRKEDEGLCLASILGLSEYAIAAILNEVTAEARMQKLCTRIEHIPASVLFNRSRKLGTPGFRWAPASLFASPDEFFRGEAAKCDALGLHVQFAGFVVTGIATYPKASPVTHHGTYYIANPEETFPKAIVGKPTNQSSYKPLKSAKPAESTNDDIIKFDQLFKATPRPSIITNPFDAHESVLVSIDSDEGEVLHATFVNRIFVRFWRTSLNALVHEDLGSHMLDVHEVASEQQWCEMITVKGKKSLILFCTTSVGRGISSTWCWLVSETPARMFEIEPIKFGIFLECQVQESRNVPLLSLM